MLFRDGHGFSPATQIPDLAGKVIIVTGGTAGLGRESVLQLSKHNPARLYLTARSPSKASSTIAGIKALVPNAEITPLEMDLASLASVKRAAERILAENDRLDVLMNNAGIMAVPPALTEDGYEIQFGTNHMGHALFTLLLLPLLQRTAAASSTAPPPRVVNLSSAGHMLAPSGGFLPSDAKTDMSSFHTLRRYGHSKLANVLFTKELARRNPAVLTCAVHPGRVESQLANQWKGERLNFLALMQRGVDVFIRAPVEKGAVVQLWAAVGEGVQTGVYYNNQLPKAGGEIGQAKNKELARKLWDWTVKEFESSGFLEKGWQR